MTTVRYQPVLGEAVEFRSGRDVPYRLISMDGLGPPAIGPVARRSPGQIGETLTDVIVPPRLMAVSLYLQAVSLSALWPVRAALSRAIVTEPVASDTLDVYALGRLRVTDRPGSPDVELSCIARSLFMPAPAGSVGFGPADIEFYAPSPWFESLYDSQLLFAAEEAGLEFPVEFPIEFATSNVEQEATNEGDVRAPVTWRVYGELEDPTLTNLTTGESLTILGSVAADEYVEVRTEFGHKSVELVEADGTRTNWMDHLDLSDADFWQLLPGANLVRFEAAVNTSGSALLLWRSRYSGI